MVTSSLWKRFRRRPAASVPWLPQKNEGPSESLMTRRRLSFDLLHPDVPAPECPAFSSPEYSRPAAFPHSRDERWCRPPLQKRPDGAVSGSPHVLQGHVGAVGVREPGTSRGTLCFGDADTRPARPSGTSVVVRATTPKLPPSEDPASPESSPQVSRRTGFSPAWSVAIPLPPPAWLGIEGPPPRRPRLR